MESIRFVRMLEQLKIRSTYERIELILSTLLAGTLLINQKIVIVLILALLLNTVYGGVKHGFQVPNRLFWPFILLFFAYLIGLIFTKNFDYGGKDIETRLTFLLFPLIYGIVKRRHSPQLSWLYWAFMVGALVYMILCWYQASQCAMVERPRFCYESSKLAVWMHPTYAALYLIAGSVFILIDAFQRKQMLLLKITAVLLALVSLYFVYQLYSLGPWIAFVNMIACLAFAFFYKRKKLVYFFGVMIVAGVTGFLAIKNLDLLRSDYDAVSAELQAYSADRDAYIEANQNNTESVKARLIIWNTSLDFVLEHPFGVGTGDRKDELRDYYRAQGMHAFANKELNPHSQYLQTAMSIGIVSSLFLIFSLFYYCWHGFKKGHYPLIALISLVATASLFESILERQWGILFFMFFLSVFTLDLRNKNEENRIEIAESA